MRLFRRARHNTVPTYEDLLRTVELLRGRADEAKQSAVALDIRNESLHAENHRLRAEIDALRELHLHAVNPATSRPYVPLDVRPDPIEGAAAEYEIDREIGTFTVTPRPPFGFGGER